MILKQNEKVPWVIVIFFIPCVIPSNIFAKMLSAVASRINTTKMIGNTIKIDFPIFFTFSCFILFSFLYFFKFSPTSCTPSKEPTPNSIIFFRNCGVFIFVFVR